MKAATTFALGLLVALFLTACATPQQPSFDYGPPELELTGASRKQVIDWLMAAKLSRGMKVANVTEHGLVASSKISGNFLASFVYGSRYDSDPDARITYNVIDLPTGGVRLYVRVEMVTNPGSGFERTSDITGRARADIEREFVKLREAFPAKPVARGGGA